MTISITPAANERMRQFLNNTPGATGVRFGASDDATTFTVVSNTEIRASHAALAAGTYDVRVVNGQGFDRSRAQLKVVDAPTFAATLSASARMAASKRASASENRPAR